MFKKYGKSSRNSMWHFSFYFSFLHFADVSTKKNPNRIVGYKMFIASSNPERANEIIVKYSGRQWCVNKLWHSTYSVTGIQLHL